MRSSPVVLIVSLTLVAASLVAGIVIIRRRSYEPQLSTPAAQQSLGMSQWPSDSTQQLATANEYFESIAKAHDARWKRLRSESIGMEESERAAIFVRESHDDVAAAETILTEVEGKGRSFKERAELHLQRMSAFERTCRDELLLLMGF